MTDPPESAEAVHAALARIRADVESRLSAVGDAAGVEALRVEVLGRSGTLTVVLRGLSRLSEARTTSGRGRRQRDPQSRSSRPSPIANGSWRPASSPSRLPARRWT